MKDIFLFAGNISYDHNFIYAFHLCLVIFIILLLAKMSTRSMQLVPRGFQNLMEVYLGFVIKMGKETFGSEELSRKYLPLVATIGLVVFFSNMIGIIPGFESPTASLNLTLTLALCVFFYYHYQGIKANGFFKYFGHFAGPSKYLAPLMFPIEIISHISRIISLSFRLFGNIKGDDLFLLVMLTLAPWIVPLIPYGLLFMMGILQAFIFMTLTHVYLASAVIIDEH